jgi:glyoxylase-like metal-dependent hydrolase (beta-lactamase superfamily II)
MFEFHVLTLGQFSRNRYWGELDIQSYRDALCTSTLVKGKMNIIVDPALPPAEMANVLYNRSGLRPDAVDAVFLTHAHGDHYVGIELFEKAQWYISAIDLEEMKRSANARVQELSRKLQPCGPGIIEGVEFIPLSGHTLGTAGILFDSDDGKVCVCGDSVMTRDFFINRQGYYNSVDFEKSSESISKIAALADVVVPGHSNYFLNKRGR